LRDGGVLAFFGLTTLNTAVDRFSRHTYTRMHEIHGHEKRKHVIRDEKKASIGNGLKGGGSEGGNGGNGGGSDGGSDGVGGEGGDDGGGGGSGGGGDGGGVWTRTTAPSFGERVQRPRSMSLSRLRRVP
jgi:hypothetical protein